MNEAAQKAVDEKFCMECGEVIKARAEICPKCGVRQIAASGFGASAPNGKNKITAGLFGILLGGLGVHKFYLGSPGMGILYLLFFWTLLPAIAGLIEGIIYLSMTDEAFARKYGTM